MKYTSLILICILFLGISPERLLSQAPQTISYQGVLTDAGGSAVLDGNYTLTFKLTSNPGNGILLWEETHADVAVTAGVFNVILGSVNPLDLPFDEPYWLGISVNGGEVMLPLIELTSTPYSLHARSVADSVVSASKIADGQVVRSINALTDDVQLTGGDNVNITTSDNAIVISASGEGGGLTLPFNETVETSQTALTIGNSGVGGVALFRNTNETSFTTVLDVTNQGLGSSARFVSSNTQSNRPALDVDMAGVVPGLSVVQTGSGDGAEIRISNEESTNDALYVETDGPGNAASLFSPSTDSNSIVLKATTSGAGTALLANVVNGNNENPAMYARHTGKGPGLRVEGAAGNVAEFVAPGQRQITIDKDGNLTTDGSIDVGTRIVFPDGTEQGTAAFGTGQHWNLTGNVNANPDTAFLGTRDQQPFEIRVNNKRALRLEQVGGVADGATLNFIAGGSSNSVSSGVVGATISGGGSPTDRNRVIGDYGTIGGGFSNQAASRAFIGGGTTNTAGGDYAVVPGGSQNNATSNYATVGGGRQNNASDDHATISGGRSNQASAIHATVGGGEQNEASGFHSTVAGGQLNQASGRDATVAGGENNSAEHSGDTVSGGEENVAQGREIGGAVVGGGQSNQALHDAATVSGGRSNIASGWTSTIAGGRENVASSQHTTVGGGEANNAADSYSTIGGGRQNVASGEYATVPGGRQNQARGLYSFAAGYEARAIHEGSFVWNDRSATFGNDSLVTTAVNQFLIRAEGGVGIGTNTPQSQLHVQEAVNASAALRNHVAIIENNAASTSNGPDVLALKTSAVSPDGRTNFITFFDGNDTAVGRIEGNGSDGVVYRTSGADYAEALPRLNPQERIEKADIVGVFAGRVSKQTTTAQHLMVVSSSPAVLGNRPPSGQEAGYENVAFLGQVPVKVRGPVEAGDYIVPSGQNDGTGVPIRPQALTMEQVGEVVGRAMENARGGAIQHVKVLVGLPDQQILQTLLAARDKQLAQQQAQLNALEARLTVLETEQMVRRVDSFEATQE